VYAASIDGCPLTFKVFGVWRKNMVMRDQQTGSIWQQATGEAIDGPLRGSQLQVMPAWETTWGTLSSAYPQAAYALGPEKFTGLIPRHVLQHMLGITYWATLDGLSAADLRLPPHQIVIGLVVNGAARAYPLNVLQGTTNLIDQLGNEAIQLVYSPAGDQVTITNQDGKKLYYNRLWWSAWSEFHPRSTIYQPAAAERSG
jgi:hypothetical protein